MIGLFANILYHKWHNFTKKGILHLSIWIIISYNHSPSLINRKFSNISKEFFPAKLKLFT
jgi:hypothetical protein